MNQAPASNTQQQQDGLPSMPDRMLPQNQNQQTTPRSSSNYNTNINRDRLTAQNDHSPSATAHAATMLTEDQLKSQLSDQGKDIFNRLTPEGKTLALKLANGSCKGKNDCKGLNSCKSDKNSCAGQSGCAGQANGLFTDKNLAVKVAAKKMAEKRASINIK